VPILAALGGSRRCLAGAAPGRPTTRRTVARPLAADFADRARVQREFGRRRLSETPSTSRGIGPGSIRGCRFL